jgi:hypothetical protein
VAHRRSIPARLHGATSQKTAIFETLEIQEKTRHDFRSSTRDYDLQPPRMEQQYPTEGITTPMFDERENLDHSYKITSEFVFPLLLLHI